MGVLSRGGGQVAGGVGDACGGDINADVAFGNSSWSDNEGIGRTAAGEEAFGAIADSDLVGIKAGNGF